MSSNRPRVPRPRWLALLQVMLLVAATVPPIGAVAREEPSTTTVTTLAAEDPGAAASAEPEPEPDPTAQPEPDPTAQPEPDPTAQPEPDPTAQPEPEPTAEPEPTTEPEPTAEPEPEPTTEPEPTAEPDPTAEPEPDPTAQPEPSVAPEPSLGAEPSPSAEPSARLDPPDPDDGPGITIFLAALTVVATATPDTLPEPGGTATIGVSVDNTSTNPATLTSLIDDLLGDLDGEGTCATGVTIEPGATYDCSYDVTVTGNAGDRTRRPGDLQRVGHQRLCRGAGRPHHA